MKKSYWMGVVCDSDNSKAAIKSWFSPLCDEMTPESADILCDIETDREKKFRAIMVEPDGKKCLVTRTRGGRRFSLTLKRIEA